MNGSVVTGIVGFLAAGAVYLIGYNWIKLKGVIPEHQRSIVISIANSQHYWIMFIALIIVSLIVSPFVEQRRFPFASWFTVSPTADSDTQTTKCPEQDQRCLTKEQKRKLMTGFAKLKTLTSYIVLAFTNGDHESGVYMADFNDVVGRAGLDPRLGFAGQGNPEVGVITALKDPTSPPPETEPLLAALQSVGIEPKMLDFPRGDFAVTGPSDFHPNIVLWIARRPL